MSAGKLVVTDRARQLAKKHAKQHGGEVIDMEELTRELRNSGHAGSRLGTPFYASR